MAERQHQRRRYGICFLVGLFLTGRIRRRIDDQTRGVRIGGLAASVHIPTASQEKTLNQKGKTREGLTGRRLDHTSRNSRKLQPVNFTNTQHGTNLTNGSLPSGFPCVNGIFCKDTIRLQDSRKRELPPESGMHGGCPTSGVPFPNRSKTAQVDMRRWRFMVLYYLFRSIAFKWRINIPGRSATAFADLLTSQNISICCSS